MCGRSDSISRKTVIEFLSKIVWQEGETWQDVQDRIVDGVSYLPSADSKRGEWIPCSERLPEEHEWIGTKEFGTTISDKVHITFDVNGDRFVKTLSLQNGELSNYEKRSMDAIHKGWKMLAWMPLPKPYKESNTK